MYAIYLRKSRKDQDYENAGEIETLARHEAALLEIAKRNGYAIGEIYREVVSGETIEARPEMKKLLQAVEAGLYEGVLVMEVERLARGNTKDQGIVSEAFSYSNTLIITPSKIYDPSNEFDEEYFEFGLFMSRREYKAINRRIQRGRIASVKEGKFVAKAAPYGYDKVKIKGAKGYTLKPNKDAEIVQLIFKLYTQDKVGSQTIANQLDAMGIKPPVSDFWSLASIRAILMNPAYAGNVRWQWRKTIKSIENGKIIEKRPQQKPGEYMLIDGLHPAIISQEAFDEAQKIRTTRGIVTVNVKKTLRNSLAGVAYCEMCGSSMKTYTKPGTTTTYLHCTNRYCSSIMNNIEPVENAVIEAIERWFADYKVNFENKYQKQDLSAQRAIIKNYQDKLKTLNKQMTNTYTLLEQGIYTIDIFKKRNEAIQAEILEAEEALKKAEETLKKLADTDSVIASYIPHTAALIDALKASASVKERNSIYKELLEKVTYLKTEKGNRYHPAPFTIRIYPKTPNLKN